MTDIRILIVCSGRFAMPAIRDLTFFKQLVVVAIPKERIETIEQVESGLTGSDVAVLKLDMDIFTEQLKEAIAMYDINIGFVLTFGRLIPSTIYNLPSKGFYNVHPGRLPDYRGADPIFWQIVNREKYAALSIHLLSDKYDNGPLVFEDRLKLETTDTHGIVTSKLGRLAANSMLVLTRLIAYDQTLLSRKQDESKSRYLKKQSKNDVIINWQTMDALSIIALINACNPWNKGAVTTMHRSVIRLLDAEILLDYSSNVAEPGTITNIVDKEVYVATLGGETIRVKSIYCDEGFFNAGWIQSLNAVTGDKFG